MAINKKASKTVNITWLTQRLFGGVAESIITTEEFLKFAISSGEMTLNMRFTGRVPVLTITSRLRFGLIEVGRVDGLSVCPIVDFLYDGLVAGEVVFQ